MVDGASADVSNDTCYDILEFEKNRWGLKIMSFHPSVRTSHPQKGLKKGD